MDEGYARGGIAATAGAMRDMGFTYPSLGPLLGTTFDKAVGIMVSRWKLLLVVSLASIVVGSLSLATGAFVFNAFLIYWNYAALANAVRLLDPSYRMTAGKVVTIIGINIGVGLATFIGLVLFVVPGVWLGNKYSLSAILAVAEDLNMRKATDRSWALTTGAFWPTLLFNIVCAFGYIGIIIAGYIMLGVLAGLGLPNVESSTASTTSTPLMNAVAIVADAIYNLSIAYATQAVFVAQLFWLKALEQRESAHAQPSPAPA